MHFRIALALLWQRSSFFEKSPRPSFLIKRAALGNLKASFHCTHWHRFFPLKKVFFRIPPSPFPKGAPPLTKPSSIVFTTPSVPLVGDRNLRRKDVNRPTRCSEPLRSKVGGPSKVFAILCGMGPPGCYGDQLAIILLKVSAWRGLAD